MIREWAVPKSVLDATLTESGNLVLVVLSASFNVAVAYWFVREHFRSSYAVHKPNRRRDAQANATATGNAIPPITTIDGP